MRRRSSGSATASTTRTPRPSRRCVHPSPLVLPAPPFGSLSPRRCVQRARAAVPSGADCSAPPFGCSCPSPPLPCSRGAAGAGARHRRERRRRHRHLRLLLGGLAELPPAADGGHAPLPDSPFLSPLLPPLLTPLISPLFSRLLRSPLPQADGGKPWRDAAYLEACARFLPEIERLGSSVTMTGCLGCCCASSSDPAEGPFLSGRWPSKADTFAAFDHDHTGSAR